MSDSLNYHGRSGDKLTRNFGRSLPDPQRPIQSVLGEFSLGVKLLGSKVGHLRMNGPGTPVSIRLHVMWRAFIFCNSDMMS